ncbi:S-adenosyl-L-methionine-dependent methyltransferase [Hypoxylon rubiginosum]|uniref:S-adenosyl-L-methionine-dependent methyltransferase n=1 Tax=Hypoxylon rubiginosum TaxID=110542 RepID=A0ACC0D4G8_9PEZI|nr:S-adenosyl-L-methionine-dependent methyltransferase [Hypoxylon rubiginosum]
MAPIDVVSAIAPTNIGAVPKLLSEVASAGEALSEAGHDSVVARRELLAKARELTRALETPREIMIQQVWAQPCNVMAISFGVQSGLWTAMANNGDGPQKVVDLAKQLGVQEELLRRMMRHIAASGYIDMTAPDEYTPNNFSKSLSLAVMGSGYHTGPPILNPAFLQAHDWLKDKGYKCPTNNLDTPYQVAHNTKLHWFAHLQANPPHGQNFNDHMHGYLLGRPGWMDEGFYPVKERLFDGFDTAKDAVLLVDVGGGFGHYTEGFLSKFPDAPGRLILQDLPPVIAQIQQLNPRIEKMEYDFFTEQPVKGARAYYTHFILHDWPDADAIKIAKRVRDAMKPGYSRFLIHEHVVPPMGQDYEQTALDLIMMTNFGAKERSPAQWSELLEKNAGLKIVKIWTPINGIESVVECVRPE